MRKFLILITLFSCIITRGQETNFKIIVKVKNLPPGSFNVKGSILLTPNKDSVLLWDTISQNKPEITLKGHILSETLATITVTGMGFFDVAVTPGDSAFINLTSNKFWDSFIILGSPKPITMVNYVYGIFRPQGLELRALRAVIDSLLLNNAEQQQINTANKIYDSVKMAHFKFNIQFADTTKSGAAVFYALNNYLNETGQYDITNYVDRARETFGESIPIQSLLLGFKKKPVSTVLLKGDSISLEQIFSDEVLQQIQLAFTKSKLLLIDFWASWCVPCIEEFPYLINAYRQYDRGEFDIIGFSLDKNNIAWQKALKKFELPWVHQLIDTTAFNSHVAKSLNIKAIPRNYLIDKTGKIYGKDLRKEELLKILKQFL